MLYGELFRVLALHQLIGARATRMGVTPAITGVSPEDVLEMEALVDQAVPLLFPKVKPPPLTFKPQAPDAGPAPS